MLFFIFFTTAILFIYISSPLNKKHKKSKQNAISFSFLFLPSLLLPTAPKKTKTETENSFWFYVHRFFLLLQTLICTSLMKKSFWFSVDRFLTYIFVCILYIFLWSSLNRSVNHIYLHNIFRRIRKRDWLIHHAESPTALIFARFLAYQQKDRDWSFQSFCFFDPLPWPPLAQIIVVITATIAIMIAA